MVEQYRCPLTASHGPSKVIKFSEAFGAGPYETDTFSILQCSTCGLGITSPVPSPDSSHLLYADRTSGDFQPGDAKLVAVAKDFFARRDARIFARESPAPRSVLDYACGNGAFARALRQILPTAKVYATDYHEEPPAGVPGNTYIPYSRLSERDGEFDLILARHVLEHTYDPTEFLSHLRKLLSKSGVLVIEVPALDTAVRLLFGKRWDGYYVPYHPLHFTKQSLAMAIESAGMKVVSAGTAEMPKMGRSLRNILGCSYNPMLFAAGAVLHPVQVLVGRFTGTAVCLRIWATR
jgi:SAM-dependent methyltransferase